jgi:hypothetical protein
MFLSLFFLFVAAPDPQEKNNQSGDARRTPKFFTDIPGRAKVHPRPGLGRCLVW